MGCRADVGGVDFSVLRMERRVLCWDLRLGRAERRAEMVSSRAVRSAREQLSEAS